MLHICEKECKLFHNSLLDSKHFPFVGSLFPIESTYFSEMNYEYLNSVIKNSL